MEIKAGEYVFVDTNILLIATDEGRQHHDTAVELFHAAFQQGISLVIAGQIVREYLVVATRSQKENGLGISNKDAISNIHEFKRFCYFCEEPESVSNRVIQLVQEYSLKGNGIHDANIVAVMEENGISNLITENTGDFKMYKGIKLVTLHDIRQYLQ